jgi:CheY-like chemotaxis protein
VKQILSFSRRSTGEKTTVQMAPLLEETYKLLRASFPATIRMKLDVQTKSDTVFVDPSLIQQVVINLANNAAYAMREAGGKLVIGLSSIALDSGSLSEKEMKPGNYVKLTVKDTGTGMTQDIQRRIFEPFFMTKGLAQGPGMGLSVVYGIVKSYDGMIEVESAVGKGSTFTILLPQAEALPTAGEDSSWLDKKHIFFVDDEPAVVEMTKTILDRIGFRVTALSGSLEALSVFSANPDNFDLVVTDQAMPDMTGVALAKEVLAIRKHMPIILCTGYSETVSPVEASEAGIRGFVMKPVTTKEMTQAIHKVLDHEKKTV